MYCSRLSRSVAVQKQMPLSSLPSTPKSTHKLLSTPCRWTGAQRHGREKSGIWWNTVGTVGV